MNWQSLTSLNQLDQLEQESKIRPILIFKHSTRCSISSAALARLERKWKLDDPVEVSAYYLDLISYREISNEISSRFSVDHQSPQAIMIYNVAVIYEASHLGISYDEIALHVQEAAGT